MEPLKSMAIIYEENREKLCKDVLSKLMFSAHYFTFIRVSPNQESSYTVSGGGETAEVLRNKLLAAHEIYIVNPKGTIVPHLNSFLSFAKSKGKPIHYLYKFCYKDCTYRKGGACSFSEEVHCVPQEHKLLPACEHYTRIYDNMLIETEKTVAINPEEPDLYDSRESAAAAEVEFETQFEAESEFETVRELV